MNLNIFQVLKFRNLSSSVACQMFQNSWQSLEMQRIGNRKKKIKKGTQPSLFHQKVPSSDGRFQVNFLCQAILLSGRKRLFLSFSSKCDKIHKVPKEKKESRDREYVFLLTFSEYQVAGQSKTDACHQPDQGHSWCAVPWLTSLGWVIVCSGSGRTDSGSVSELVSFDTAGL